jgi:hypothetical protein
MAYLLLQIIQDIPPHVHIGILMAATVPSSASEQACTTFSYIDLTSPVPHMLHYVQYADEEDDDEEEIGNLLAGGGLLDRMALVPADSLHLPSIHAAIRSLVDYDPSQHATTQRSYTMSMPLGKAVETVLDFMDRSQHPGSPDVQNSTTTTTATSFGGAEEENTKVEDEICYAGGKIMAFLGSCPTDLRGDDWRPLTRKSLPRTTIGMGGFGGAVQRTATDFGGVNGGEDSNGAAATSSTAVDEETGTSAIDASSSLPVLDTDMTPSSLLDYYRAPEHVEAYFQELGTQCADAALGVDIFVLVQPQNDDDCTSCDDSTELDVGLPFLRGLSDRSGAPGPLVFPLHQGYSTPIASNPDIQRLQREVYSRVPWGSDDDKVDEGEAKTGKGRHQTMAFGGELRLRLSPSFDVDRSPVDAVEEGPQLAPLYSSGGVMGPASEEEEGGNLWRFGTCDPFTAVTIDLDMKDKKAKDRLRVDGMGEIAWKPVLQSCFAYTTIVKDPEVPGEYLTVRQMRIACARAPLTDSVETLYASLDPEVIGAVLFHKLTLTLLRDGLSTAQTIGEDWLKSLLVCAYQSAEAHDAVQRDQAEQGLGQQQQIAMDSSEKDDGIVTFYPNERLLDREGELSAEDVLLAQGHDRLKTLPLTVYSLLHCDAIRPSSSSKKKLSSSAYLPTMDARCAAGAQMSSMIPATLAKCIAPRLQLWSCSEGMILDMIDLRMEAARLAVEEFGTDARSGKPRGDLVFFMDAPDCIVVCSASYVSNKARPKKKAKITIGPDLQRAINAAVNGYRTPPNVIYDLNDGSENASSGQEQGFLRLTGALVEDLPGSNGATSFKQWGEHLASEIHE